VCVKNRRFARKYRLSHQSEKDEKNSSQRLQLLVTANLVPSSPILATLMMEAICSCESSVLATATRNEIPLGPCSTGTVPVFVSCTGFQVG
jgi:hypothetical protein